MGTKNKPGKFDCYENADPDEPMFILLARDPLASILVDLWAQMRALTRGDSPKVLEAIECAGAMRRWKPNASPAPAGAGAPRRLCIACEGRGCFEAGLERPRCNACDGKGYVLDEPPPPLNAQQRLARALAESNLCTGIDGTDTQTIGEMTPEPRAPAPPERGETEEV